MEVLIIIATTKSKIDIIGSIKILAIYTYSKVKRIPIFSSIFCSAFTKIHSIAITEAKGRIGIFRNFTLNSSVVMTILTFKANSQSGASFYNFGIVIFPPERRKQIIKGGSINHISHFISKTKIAGYTFYLVINKTISN